MHDIEKNSWQSQRFRIHIFSSTEVTIGIRVCGEQMFILFSSKQSSTLLTAEVAMNWHFHIWKLAHFFPIWPESRPGRPSFDYFCRLMGKTTHIKFSERATANHKKIIQGHDLIVFRKKAFLHNHHFKTSVHTNRICVHESCLAP